MASIKLPFKTEYALSGRAKCCVCHANIEKDSLRIATKYSNWHHESCFFENHRPKSAGDIENLVNLRSEDQERVKKTIAKLGSVAVLPEIKSKDDLDAQKVQLEKKDESKIAEEKKLTEKVKSQMKSLFQFRDNIKEKMSIPDIVSLLEKNEQEPFKGVSGKLYDQLADMLAFGAIQECSVCDGQKWLFEKDGYLCYKQTAERQKCMNSIKKPNRDLVVISEKLRLKYPFLMDVQKVVRTRAIQYIAPSPATSAKTTQSGKSKTYISIPKSTESKDDPAVYPDIELENKAHDCESEMDPNLKPKVMSKLRKPVQDLVKLMFDVDTMKRTMLEFDLDMEKMPLGKLSQEQLSDAYKVLTEIVGLIQNAGSNTQFIDATNRFYTLIPHNFGVRSPPLLNTITEVDNLSAMLDSLMEIEFAYNLIKAKNVNNDVNPIDKYYDQLKTTLEPLDKKSEEFALLKKYVENTHADTHKMYDLEIVDVFKVARQGEARRFEPFKKLHNRRLLWHGSRLTNFAGILSHGLKIPSPEAPDTRYTFGKGIYFADMVSKSANNCCTTKQNSTGFMLLCEVALGEMLECKSANYKTKLPEDRHSTFGMGCIMPDPNQSHFRKDGVTIPLGKSITDNQYSFMYNEFVVYDIDQVNIQYLLRMNFKYKY